MTGTLYYDADGDGVVDGTMAGWTIRYDDSSGPRITVTTRKDGSYELTGYVEPASGFLYPQDEPGFAESGLFSFPPEDPARGDSYDFVVVPDKPPDRIRCDCEGWSCNPVRYADGVVKEETVDLASGFLSHTRSWTNDRRYDRDGRDGNGWVVHELPTLASDGSGVVAVFNGYTAEWFDGSGPYTARHDSRDTLTKVTADDGSGRDDYVLTREDGAQIRFYDLSTTTTLPSAQRGAFKSFRDAAGNLTWAEAYDAQGRVVDVRRSVTSGGATTLESFLYEYVAGTGPNAGRLERVTFRRSTTGETGLATGTVRKVEYTYYDGTGIGEHEFGNLGDLRTAKVMNAAGASLDTWHYRYYGPGEADGYAGGLQFVFTADAYARLDATFANALTVSNEDAAPYAARHYKYDAQRRISQEIVAGAGSNMSGDGRGTIRYAYETSTHPDGYNSWKTKTTETLADGNRNVVFTNHLGQVMLRVYEDATADQTFSTKRLATFHKYDDDGRVVMTAYPSAFAPVGGSLYDQSKLDLLDDSGDGIVGDGRYVYLGDDFGQIDLFEYATANTTGIDDDTSGDVLGLLRATKVKRGDVDAAGTADDPILLAELSYYEKTYTPTGTGAVTATTHPVASESVYPDATEAAPGNPSTTDYGYTWHLDAGGASTVLPESIKLERPLVSAGNNGPGTGRDTDWTFFDKHGNPVWTKDAEGFLNYFAWDPVTGALVKEIIDVNHANTADFTGLPSGWATPASGGLHLVTSMAADALGRTTKITYPRGDVDHFVYKDAQHEVRTYRAWNSTTHTTTGPIEVVRQYRPADDAPAGERALYTEVLTTHSATPGYNTTTHEPDGTEAISSSSIQSLSRAITNNSGQVTELHDFFSLSGVTYSQAVANLGTASNDSSTGNRHTTEYGYDAAGRLSRVKAPSGTITRTVFDGRGNPAAVWAGTDDTGATDLDPDGAGSPNNMAQVSETIYDESCGCPSTSGDGNPTKITLFPGGGADPRVTQFYYDWRSRLVASKEGVQATEGPSVQRPIFYYDLNNLGQVLASYRYDGDNEAVTETNGTPNKPSASLLRAKTATLYDEQLRPFRSLVYSVNPGTGAVGGSLATDFWFDRRGSAIKTLQPGGLTSKLKVDGAGRVTKEWLSDGGGDPKPGQAANWDHADDVTGDAVLEQAETAYDANSNPTRVTTRQRFHDETGTGELGNITTAPKARVSYAGMYYDAADRLTAVADIGTNGGSTDTSILNSLPARSDTVLVDSFAYSGGGWLEDATDPRGIVTRRDYDLLGRTKAVTEAYDGSSQTSFANRTTRYTFSGLDDVLTMTADLPDGTADQTTRYEFGVTTAGGSALHSNDLLREVRYPKEVTPDAGTPGTDASDKKQHTYNALGQTLTFTDHNGTRHDYAYDVVGRPTKDTVAVLAAGVDGRIRRVETLYDSAGLVDQVNSYDAVTGGSRTDFVDFGHNGLGQLASEQQAQYFPSTSMTVSQTVNYAYSEDFTNNHSRLTHVTYPNGRRLRHQYDGSTLDNAISRVSRLSDHNFNSGNEDTHLEEYSYLGLGTIVKRAHPEAGLDLSYVTAGATGVGGDQYTGLDQFGRVIDQKWVKPSSGEILDRFQYTYNRNSNRLTMDVAAGVTGGPTDKDEAYTYDNFDRLTKVNRGTLTGTPPGISDAAANFTRRWDGAGGSGGLDALGNWQGVREDADGGGAGAAVDQSRTHDSRNQLNTLDADGGGAGTAVNLTQDPNGNTTTDETGKTYVYDAWDRLVEVKSGPDTLLRYTYDGLGRRTTREDTAASRKAVYYYNDRWQVVEEQVGFSSDWASSGSTNSKIVKSQYIWSEAYIDALVLRDHDTDNNKDTGQLGKPGHASKTGLDERLYAAHDANFNVTALVATNGQVVERYRYDPYGAVTFLNADFTPRTGNTSGKQWLHLFQGGRLETVTGNFHFRHRDYRPSLGRPLQQDPVGYADGANLYLWELSSPGNRVDPYGLAAAPGTPERFRELREQHLKNPNPHAFDPVGDALRAAEREFQDECQQQPPPPRPKIAPPPPQGLLSPGLKGLGEGLLQGLANAANAVTDVVTLGYGPEWSEGLVINEKPEERAASRGLANGGVCLISLGTGGAAFAAGRGGAAAGSGAAATGAARSAGRRAGMARIGGPSPNIPGRPFRGPNAARDAFKHLKDNHGIPKDLASKRLHECKKAAGLRADDDVIIGRTGDLHHPRTGELIGSLTAGGAKGG